MSRCLTCAIGLVTLWLYCGPGLVSAQQTISLADRGPRFVAAWSTQPTPDVRSEEVLRRRISLNLRQVPVAEALKAIVRAAKLEMSYSPSLLPLGRVVSLKADNITVAAALTETLLDVPVDVVLGRAGTLALVGRTHLVPAHSGTVIGHVTDAETGTPLIGATVAVQGTSLTVSTGQDGAYRILGLAQGLHTLRARYIGYGAGEAVVAVTGAETVTQNFALSRAVQTLEEVVTTGTVVPTEVKALPTPIAVVDAEDIERRRPVDLKVLLRQAVPAAVSWFEPGAPLSSTSFQLRGATTLTGPTGAIKVLIDGVEAADRSRGGVDLNSIERIEVIRGPQAATIYGSEAMGGVIQIFTKRGTDSGLNAAAEGSLGLVQMPYESFGTVSRQMVNGSVSGGGADGGFNVGASVTRLGEYVPEGAQTSYGVHGGMRGHRGMFSFDLSGRYYLQNAATVLPPTVLSAGFGFFSRPFYWDFAESNQTVGLTLGLTPTRWWRHGLIVGVDHTGYDLAQTRARLTTPDDTLLFVDQYSNGKTSVAYNSSVHGDIAPDVTGIFTVGLDHYRLTLTDFGGDGLLSTSGSLNPSDGYSLFGTRDVTTNYGIFAQGQVGIRDALFLTAGARGEHNSQFGDELGVPVSPRFGASYVRNLGSVSVKLRGSWGRGIRPPSPGLKNRRVTGAGIRLANPFLGPERQQGWDAGFDVVLASDATLALTYYDQNAEGLIQSIALASTPVPTSRFQNIGKVRNRGLELEGRIAVEPFLFQAQYAYTRSRVEALSPSYTGDLRVGDQVFNIPRHTLGASVSLNAFSRTTVTAGLTYMGGREQYDYLGYYQCLGSTGPCRNDTFDLNRDYIIGYPGFAKVDLALSHRLNDALALFANVENAADNDAYELSNESVVMGRITTIGIRLEQ